MVVAKTSASIPTFLAEFHASPFGGHSGFYRTYKRISSVLFWDGLKSDIRDFISRCDVCQCNKYQAMSPVGLLQPLPIPKRVSDEVSMDFIGGLPLSHGFDTIMVVVDRFTKYSHFVGLRYPYSTKQVANSFVKEIVRLHGFPSSITSDRDRVFISQFWAEDFRSSGTSLRHSTTYHPQTNGQTEVVNNSLETYLHCFSGTHPKKWSTWLHWAEFWFNTTYQSAASMTPFKALYRRDPLLFRFVEEQSAVEKVNTQIQKRNLILDELKKNLVKAQHRMKKAADCHRRDIHYEVGDWVYLKLQPYRLHSIAKRPNEKLSPRCYSPFQVAAKIGQVAYRLHLPSDAHIHPVFHVSQLKSLGSHYP